MIDDLDGYWTQVGGWTEKVLSSSMGEACALLITLLPDLESTTLLVNASPGSHFFDVVSRIAEISSMTDPTFSPALFKLSRANLSNRKCAHQSRLEDNHDGYEAQRLVDVLPASIETLELVRILSEWSTNSMLAGLSNFKRERVPRLGKIRL